MSKGKKCWTLFVSMLPISAFTFGGGFVIVSLMKKRFVDQLGYLSEDEMLDMTAIAQASPGPIAVNAAILVGRRAAGAAGIACAVLGTVIPPIVTLGLISLAYEAFAGSALVQAVLKGMQAGAAAVVADVALGLGLRTARERDWLSILLAVLAFAAVLCWHVSAVWIILSALLVGAVRVVLEAGRARRC